MRVEESLNVTFDETHPPPKTSPLEDDDLVEEEAIEVNKTRPLGNDVEDKSLESNKIINIKESKSHPLENAIDIQCASSDTRPPMLNRTDFASWQQRIRLYCRGKENGVNIMKSIDEGPFQMGTIKDTLAKGTEGSHQLGLEQARVYTDLSPEDKDRHRTTLINHYTNAKDIWDNVKMLLEGSELTKEDCESQLYDDFEHFRQNKGEMIHDYYGRQNIGQGNNARGTSDAGHIARNCTHPKRPHNSEYFKDKMMLMQAQENRVVLDEEQLLFISADDYDAFDFDVDEAPTAQTMFIENLSSTDLVYDEAGPSYDSDILSEVLDHDNYQDAVCEHHECVKDNTVSVVQSNVSSVQNDAYMMIINEMHEQATHCAFMNEQNKVVSVSLTAELATYKEQVELYERRVKFELTEREQNIEEQLRIVITERNIKEEN
ncbi:hypothetical protein Tco_1346719 [Tanacetum coccineum]